MLKLSRYPTIDNGRLDIKLKSLIDPKDLARSQDRFTELALNDFPAAFQYALIHTARDAQEGLGDAIEDAFDNPVAFSHVNPDDLRRTSIRRWSTRVPTDKQMSLKDVESRVYVMRKQSVYSKEDIRRKGDIGLGGNYIGIPIWENLERLQGIRPTRKGNLHKNALATLHSRKSKSTMKRKEWGRLMIGHHQGHNTTFFGTPKSGGIEGWYDRPEPTYARRGPVLTRGPMRVVASSFA